MIIFEIQRVFSLFFSSVESKIEGKRKKTKIFCCEELKIGFKLCENSPVTECQMFFISSAFSDNCHAKELFVSAVSTNSIVLSCCCAFFSFKSKFLQCFNLIPFPLCIFDFFAVVSSSSSVPFSLLCPILLFLVLCLWISCRQ